MVCVWQVCNGNHVRHPDLKVLVWGFPFEQFEESSPHFRLVKREKSSFSDYVSLTRWVVSKKHEKSQHGKTTSCEDVSPIKNGDLPARHGSFLFFFWGGGCYISSLVVGDSDHLFRSESLLGHLLLKPRRFSCTLKVFQKTMLLR